MFKKPVKKIQQRRVFSAHSDEEPMDVDAIPDPPRISSKDKKKDRKEKEKSSSKSQPQKSLLSFDNEGILTRIIFHTKFSSCLVLDTNSLYFFNLMNFYNFSKLLVLNFYVYSLFK